MSEADIADFSERFMRQSGISKFWYHGLAALVLVGKRTPLSVSGRQYRATDTVVAVDDLVTVDLSPENDGAWGDFARSFVVGSQETFVDACPISGELQTGLETERLLHERLQKTARPDHTFEELFITMNELIDQLGYLNLDFNHNLGHSIEDHLDRRRYIEKGCRTKLGDVAMFTFEPHIRAKRGSAGVKRENIYYFESGKLVEL